MNQSLETLAHASIAEIEAWSLVVEAATIDIDVHGVRGPELDAVPVVQRFSVARFDELEQSIVFRRPPFVRPENVRIADDRIGERDNSRRVQFPRFSFNERLSERDPEEAIGRRARSGGSTPIGRHRGARRDVPATATDQQEHDQGSRTNVPVSHGPTEAHWAGGAYPRQSRSEAPAPW